MVSSCRLCKKNLQADRLKKSEDHKKSNGQKVTTDDIRTQRLIHQEHMRKLYKRPETTLQGLAKMLSERKKAKEAAEAEADKVTNDDQKSDGK